MEPGIILQPAMVRAVWDGFKTQTRRRMLDKKGRPTVWATAKPGDKIWVRENFATPYKQDGNSSGYVFMADCHDFAPPFNNALNWTIDSNAGRWHPSIHLAQKWSRLTLVLTAVRPDQRPQGISDPDILAEGIREIDGFGFHWFNKVRAPRHPFPTARVAFTELWTEINGVDSWLRNEPIVALSFEVHRQNISKVSP